MTFPADPIGFRIGHPSRSPPFPPPLLLSSPRPAGDPTYPCLRRAATGALHMGMRKIESTQAAKSLASGSCDVQQSPPSLVLVLSMILPSPFVPKGVSPPIPPTFPRRREGDHPARPLAGTTSFGSVCLGSLGSAAVRVAEVVARSADFGRWGSIPRSPETDGAGMVADWRRATSGCIDHLICLFRQ